VSRPTRALLAHLAEALDRALADSFIDRLWLPSPRSLLIRFPPLRPRRLFIELEPGHPRVIVTERWPDTPPAPDRAALVLRRALEGARVHAVTAEDDRRLVLELVRGGARLNLSVQLAGRYLNVGLYAEDGAEIARLVHGSPGRDPESPALPDRPDPYASLEGEALLARLDAESWDDADRRAAQRAVSGLARRARKEIARLTRAATAAEEDLDRAEAAAADRHRGELLKSVLGRVPRGAAEIAVPDWSEEGRPTVVPLDPALDAVGNMERFFKRYRRFARAIPDIEQRLLDALEAKERAEALHQAIAALGGALEAGARPAEVLAQADALGPLLPRSRAQAAAKGRGPAGPALPYRAFTGSDGASILVGKGARANDELTFRVARGNDVWLHARDASGAHVILRRAGAGPPPHEALLDAAHLAAWNSQARDEAVIDVMWTERKHVRKLKGGAPGQVTAAGAHNLLVRLDPARIAALYQSLDRPE